VSAPGYDAERAPEPSGWLASGQPERVGAVEAFHAASKAPHPVVERPRIHAALHVVIEDQIARNDPPETARAVARLVAAGWTRHDAVHAAGQVASAALAASLSSGKFDLQEYARALDAIDPGRP
jgi:hypothetical protein